jgi:hypothetical protein
MEYDIARAKQLIEEREEIDRQLAVIFGGGKVRSAQKCSRCDQEGHTARNCPQKMPAATI